jgi:hypothetical protein
LRLQRKPDSVIPQEEAVWDTMRLMTSFALNVGILGISYVGNRKKSSAKHSKLIIEKYHYTNQADDVVAYG